MHELTRRCLELYRQRPELADKTDVFRLATAGLQTEDLPDSWDFHFAMHCAEYARRLFHKEKGTPCPEST